MNGNESKASRASRLMENPRYKWWVVGMLWFICFFNYADRQAIFSIFPILEKDYGFNKAELGLISLAFPWVYALTAPFAGQVSDRWLSRKIVILAGLYVWSAITGFTALCSKVWHFVLVRGAEGLGETFYFPASMSLVSDYHARDTRSRAMSLHQTSVYAGSIGGGALAGWMAEQYGWRWPFVLLAVLGIALGLVLNALLREPERNEAERKSAGASFSPETPEERLPVGAFLRELARTPTALILVAAFFGANFVALIFLTWMPTFLKEKYQLSLTAAGLGATVFVQTGSMVGSLLGGFLADLLRRRHAGGRILTQALGALLGAPFLFLCGYTREAAVLMVALTLFGLFKGVYDANIWASLYDVVAPSRRGTAVGLMNMVAWLGGGLGPFTIGVAVNEGVSMSVALSATAVIYGVVAALLLCAALVFAPRDRRNQSE